MILKNINTFVIMTGKDIIIEICSDNMKYIYKRLTSVKEN